MHILYLATADARGHLMRCQLLSHQLQSAGHQVTVLTTSQAGIDFLAHFKIKATIFTTFYYVEFDSQQNMKALATDWRIIRYFFLPWHMLTDIIRLKKQQKKQRFDLIINDSLHPALISAPFFGIRNIVHIHGETLLKALHNNFKDRLPNWLANGFGKAVSYFLSKAKTQLLHNQHISHPKKLKQGWLLPNPVQIPNRNATDTYRCYGFNITKPLALIYLNPHFQDDIFIEKLEQLLFNSNWQFVGISEYYSYRPHWQPYSNDFANLTYTADLLISAAGMAALRLAKVNSCPLLTLATAQPEQQYNLQHLQHNAPHFNLEINNPQHWQQANTFLAELVAKPHPKPSLETVITTTQTTTQYWLDLLKQLVNPTQENRYE